MDDRTMTTAEEATQLFRKAGEIAGWKPGVGNPLVINYLRIFADLVKAEENEACARVCEARSKRPNDGNWAAYEWDAICGTNELAAEEIRARRKA